MPHLRRIYLLPPDLEDSAVAVLWMAGTLGVQSTTAADGRLRLEAWFPLDAEPFEMISEAELEIEDTMPDADWFATWRERAQAVSRRQEPFSRSPRARGRDP